MAKKNSYQEKKNPVYQILYIVTIVVLLALLVFMYRNWQNKRKQYDVLVEQAAITEADYDIETRKLLNNEVPDEEEEEETPLG